MTSPYDERAPSDAGSQELHGEELDHGRAVIGAQLPTYQALAAAVAETRDGGKAAAALEAFEASAEAAHRHGGRVGLELTTQGS